MSLVVGSPLAEEPGQGAHTIGGYLRDVAARYGAAEAVVMRKGEARLSWSYDDLVVREQCDFGSGTAQGHSRRAVASCCG
ncbi:hypothetical protein B2G71_21215, partial [Novosphingobium sp. PC22D]